MGRCPQFRDSAIYLSAATCPQVPGGQVSVDGGRKLCPPSTPIGLPHSCKPSGPRRWIAEFPAVQYDYGCRIAGLKLNLAILHLRRSFRLVRVAVLVDSEEDLLHTGGQFALLAETVSVGEV